MALTAKFKVLENEKGTLVQITDLTGAYSPSNPNGFGAPNPEYTAVTAVKIKFESMDEDSVFTIVGAETNFFASIDPEDYFVNQIPHQMSLELPDGWYKITYTITTNLGDTISYIYKAFYSDARCCFKKKALKEAGCKCNCKDGKYELWEIGTYIEAVKAAEEAQNGLAALDAINALAKLCSSCGCNC